MICSGILQKWCAKRKNVVLQVKNPACLPLVDFFFFFIFFLYLAKPTCLVRGQSLHSHCEKIPILSPSMFSLIFLGQNLRSYQLNLFATFYLGTQLFRSMYYIPTSFKLQQFGLLMSEESSYEFLFRN